MNIYLKKIAVTAFFSFFLLCLSCKQSGQKAVDSGINKESGAVDSIQVFHGRYDLIIEIKSELTTWKQSILSVADSTALISLLVEPHTQVKQGDVLASLWGFSNKNEYTPMDLIAPFNGTVAAVYYKVGDQIKAESPIIELKNYDYYLMVLHPEPEQLRYIKKNASVLVQYQENSEKGWVEKVNKKQGEVLVLLKNKEKWVKENLTVDAKIHCGNFVGDYIYRKYFGAKNKMTALVEDEIILNLKAIGFSDSLALVYPSISNLDYIKNAKSGDVD